MGVLGLLAMRPQPCSTTAGCATLRLLAPADDTISARATPGRRRRPRAGTCRPWQVRCQGERVARAEQQKEVGNRMFAKGKLDAAIEAYSEAICFSPKEPVYYTNRAMCHRKRENWQAVTADCERALSLDDTSIKGHYLLGVALELHVVYSNLWSTSDSLRSPGQWLRYPPCASDPWLAHCD